MRLDSSVLLLVLCVSPACGHTQRSGYFPDHLHIEPGVVAELSIIAGLIVCFYGFRLLRTIVFIAGFVVTGLLVSSALANICGLETWVLAASWISFFVFGVAGGCVALAFSPLGVILVGSLLAYAITLSLPYRMLPLDSSAILNGVIMVLGGMLGWLLVRPFTVVATSFVGAVSTVRGIGYFTGKYPTTDELKAFHSRLKRSDLWVDALPKPWWAFLAATIAVLIAGIVKQCRDIDKTRSYHRIGRSTGWRSIPNFPIP